MISLASELCMSFLEVCLQDPEKNSVKFHQSLATISGHFQLQKQLLNIETSKTIDLKNKSKTNLMLFFGSDVEM